MAVRECDWFYINVPSMNIQIKLKLMLKFKRVLGLVLRERELPYAYVWGMVFV